jgi:Fe-S-cluster containining protein
MDFIYPEIVRFRCNNCGICCGDTKEKKRQILMLDEEAKLIESKLGKNISEFTSICNYKTPYVYEMKKNENGKCVFLSSDCKCSIYSNRPLICRFYPFELVNRIEYEFLFSNECPGINWGKKIGKKYFADLFRLANLKFKNIKKVPLKYRNTN